MTHSEEQRIDQLRETGAELYRRGWSLATSSNYSVVVGRDPLELLVTISGKDKGRLGREDFVRVGALGQPLREGGQPLREGGQPLREKDPKSSAETMLHVVLAEELASVGAILHTHSVWGTVLSGLAEKELVIGGYEMLKAFEGVSTHETSAAIPVFDNTQDIPALAEEVRGWLRGCATAPAGFLIRRHGLYTWGESVAAARRQIEAFEFLFECEYRRLLIEGQRPHPPTPLARD